MQISLSGNNWEIKPFYGMDWLMRGSFMPDTHDTRGWQRATVPGSVVNDLWINKAIPNPYFERNSLLIEWVPQRTWLYRKTFTVPDDIQGRRVRLRLEGVDYAAQFYLNGELLGEHASMHTPVAFDVSSQLRFGEDNVLVVVLEAAPLEQPQVSRTSLVRTFKSRMAYWWDFCPRMVHVGVWDHVYLDVTGPVRVDDLWVRSEISDDLSRATVQTVISLDTLRPSETQVLVTLHHSGTVLAQQRIPASLEAGQTSLTTEFEVDHPSLWWPNGYGEQPLYEAEVVLLDEQEEMDSRAVTFGIRQISFVPNDTPDQTALPYTLQVNGRKIYMKGWNWVPIDVLYGVERPEKLEHLLTLAQQAHVVLLRVWGGGLIEKEAFYNLCDQMGILVWQEFIQSSSGIDNIPASDPDYLAVLETEARQIIQRKRNHPSLAIWCGGNELTGGPEQPLTNSHPALGLLHHLVEELDPGRMWLPTSPSGRVFSNSLALIKDDPLAQHDVHGPWEYQGLTDQYTLYNCASSLLHSEFGAEGITNLKTLEVTVSPENCWPVTLDSPVWFHLAAWWVKEASWRQTLGEIGNLGELIRGTQFLQAEGVRYAIEANRRRKYQNSGTLPWQFNEPYPMAACTSAVDYYGYPKPLYHAVARAYAPLLVSARFSTLSWANEQSFEAELWASNSYDIPIEGTLHARLVGAANTVYASIQSPVRLLPNGTTALSTLRRDLADVEDLFFLDLVLLDSAEQVIASNRYLFTHQPTFAPVQRRSAAGPSVTLAQDEDEWFITLQNRGPQTAFYLWLEDARPRGETGYPYFSDNYFCMLPGEKRSVLVTWQGVPIAERQLGLEGWNVPPMML